MRARSGPLGDRRRALAAPMTGQGAAHYPAPRRRLHDARRTFLAPVTVFGAVRAAPCLGRSYLALTGAEQVRAMSRRFDGLVRAAVAGPDVVDGMLGDLAEGARR